MNTGRVSNISWASSNFEFITSPKYELTYSMLLLLIANTGFYTYPRAKLRAFLALMSIDFDVAALNRILFLMANVLNI